MSNEITLRQAIIADLPKLKELFKGTIMYVCADDYDEAQRKVSASSAEKAERWEYLIKDQYVMLAEKEGIIVGFGSLLNGDYLDFMYVYKNCQRQGIADNLLTVLEAEAIRHDTKIITSDISKTARPFFQKKSYEVIAEQENAREGIILVNYKMQKRLNKESEA